MARKKCKGTIQNIISLLREGKIKEIELIFEKYHCRSVHLLKNTLLHYSAAHGYSIMTEYLLNRGANANTALNETTPLMMAVKGKYDACVQILVKAGANMLMRNRKNESALEMFCVKHNFSSSTQQWFLRKLQEKISDSKKIAQILIDAGCHLYQAAYMKNAKVLEHMLQANIPIDSTHPISKETALHVAFSFEDVESVKVLLKYGADINALDADNATPLYHIFDYNNEDSYGKMELLRIAINAKASLTSCTSEGYFQITEILSRGYGQVIRIMLQANIDLMAKDEINGGNVLHHLAVNKNPDAIEALKLHIKKFDVNFLDGNNMNALILAVGNSNVNMVKFLLKQGADPNCKYNFHGNTPLFYAYLKFDPYLEKQSRRCIELLLQHNADPQYIATDEDGQMNTIFDFAFRKNSSVLLKPIIAHLALQEMQDIISINETISKKINYYQPFRIYFNRCQEWLQKDITGTISLVKLLTCDKKQMARYLNNRGLLLELKNSKNRRFLKTFYPYYYNILLKRILSGFRYKKMLNGASEVICRIFENRIDKTNIIVNGIIDCLDKKSLQQLYQLSRKPSRRKNLNEKKSLVKKLYIGFCVLFPIFYALVEEALV